MSLIASVLSSMAAAFTAWCVLSRKSSEQSLLSNLTQR